MYLHLRPQAVLCHPVGPAEVAECFLVRVPRRKVDASVLARILLSSIPFFRVYTTVRADILVIFIPLCVTVLMGGFLRGVPLFRVHTTVRAHVLVILIPLSVTKLMARPVRFHPILNVLGVLVGCQPAFKARAPRQVGRRATGSGLVGLCGLCGLCGIFTFGRCLLQN